MAQAAFIPAAIEDLTEEQATALAHSPRHLSGWRTMERERVAADWLYFVGAYGSVEPATGAVPFRLWPAQHEIAEALNSASRVIVLKNRQQGLSWLALHRALWLAAFSQEHEGARIAIYCKGREDASLQLRRVRRVIERLPEWLRPEIAADSTTRIDFEERGGASIRILSGDPEALRGDTLTLLILDEFAYVRNGMAPDVWAAALPAVEHGQMIVISTGNGDVGDGAKFAELWRDAEASRSDLLPIFLGRDAHPGRDAQWFAREARRVGDPDRFAREYPEKPDDALRAPTDASVFSGTHLAAAERLAAEIDRDELEGAPCEVGIDWGDTMTAAVYAYPLPLAGGGIYIAAERALSRTEPSRAARAILEGAPAAIKSVASDSQPPGTVRTAEDVLADMHAADPEAYPEVITRVVFSTFKEGGSGKRGVDTVGYLRFLLANTAETQPGGEPPGPRIAIDPACKTLLAQARGLQRDARGRIAKPALDAARPERGDHVVDALIALAAARALAHWQGNEEGEPEETPHNYDNPNWWR